MLDSAAWTFSSILAGLVNKPTELILTLAKTSSLDLPKEALVAFMIFEETISAPPLEMGEAMDRLSARSAIASESILVVIQST